MGIQGKLLIFLKPATDETHVSQFHHQTAGVDIFSWLYKAYLSAWEEMRNDPQSKAFLGRIHLMLDLLDHYHITPICVFDGKKMRKKAAQNKKRADQKTKNEQLGTKLMTVTQEQAALLEKEEELLHQRMGPYLEEEEEEQEADFFEQLKMEAEADMQEELVEQSQLEVQSETEIKPKIEDSHQIEIRQGGETVHENNDPFVGLGGRPVEERGGGFEERLIIDNQSIRAKEEIDRQLLEINAIKINVEAGRKHLKRSVRIPEPIIATTMRALIGRGVEFMVAPYEAESQLAKLHSLGLIDFAISEDSDLIIYETPTLFKMSPIGNGDYINLNKKDETEVSDQLVRTFMRMSKQKKTEVAGLSGNDYNKSVGIMAKAAVKHIHDYGNAQTTVKILRRHKTKYKKVLPNHEALLFETKLIFLFATTFNPKIAETGALEGLNQTLMDQDFDFEGLDYEEVLQITGKHYEDYNPAVKDGWKSAWSMVDRDRTPIVRESESTLDLVLVLEQEQLCRERMAVLLEQRRVKMNKSKGPVLKQSTLNFVKKVGQKTDKLNNKDKDSNK